MRFFKDTNYNFVKYGRVAFVFSITLIIASIVSLVIKGGPNLSIDFAGGLKVDVKLAKRVTLNELSDIRDRLNVEEVHTVGLREDELLIQSKGTDVADEISKAVYQYRKEHGTIKDLSELKNIEGIDRVSFEHIETVFTVGEVKTEATTRVSKEEEDIVSPIEKGEKAKTNINAVDLETMLERFQEVVVLDLKEKINKVLSDIYPPDGAGNIDLNRIDSREELVRILSDVLPENRAYVVADRIADFRNLDKPLALMRLIPSFTKLKSIAGLSEDEVRKFRDAFCLSLFNIRGIEVVGPRVSGEITRLAFLALLYSTIGMLIYIAFRFDFRSGVIAIVALIHDVVITIGFASFLNIEISLEVIAAILTIVGYSINDTVVYYDRVREGLLQQRKETYAESLNRCINENLSRTVLTGVSSLLVLGVLYFLGGLALRDFALILIIGIILGTYSSIYIAAPLLIEWDRYSSKRRGVRAKRRKI